MYLTAKFLKEKLGTSRPSVLMRVLLRLILIFVGVVGAHMPALAQRSAEPVATKNSGMPPTQNDSSQQTCQTNLNWSIMRYSVDIPATSKDYTVTEKVDTVAGEGDGQTITHEVACPWGVTNYLGLGVDMQSHTSGANGKDGLSAARRDRLSVLAPSSTICSVEFVATSDEFSYDDYVFLTLNNRIVAAGQYYESELKKLLQFTKDPITNLYQFDLARLINSNHYVYSTVGADNGSQTMRNEISNAYCAPGADCLIPKSDLNRQNSRGESV